jgi:hypothetical protein
MISATSAVERRCVWKMADLLRAQLFYDGYRRTRADAIRTGFDHGQSVLRRADSAGGFHANIRANDGAHQTDIFDGGTGGGHAGGRLDEIGAGFDGKFAGEFLFVLGEEASFDDDFEMRLGIVRGIGESVDFVVNKRDIAILERADVDDHIYFLRTLANAGQRFEQLHGSKSGALRKSDDGASEHIRALQQFGRKVYPNGLHADAGEVVLASLFAELFDLRFAGIGFKDGMVDESSDGLPVASGRNRRRHG